MSKILVIGSTVCDIMIYLDTLPSREGDAHIQFQRMQLGGCAYNVARFLREIAEQVTFLSPVGRGIYGDFVAAELIKQGFEIPVKLDGLNGCCYCFVEADGERTFLSDHGAEYSFDRLWLEKLETKSYDYIYVCGLEIEEPTGQELISALDHLSGQVIFAPGPRLLEIPKDRMTALLAKHPILHLNEIEAISLANVKTIGEALPLLYTKTKQLVIATLGADGAVAFDGEWHYVSGYPTDIVDTIGAGDTHVAAVIAALSHQKTIAEVLDFANKSSSKVVASQGTYLTEEEYTKLKQLL